MKIISEPSATRYMAFKVIRSSIEIAITPIAFKFVVTFHHVTGAALQMFNVRGQRSRSQRTERKIMYQQQKRFIRQW